MTVRFKKRKAILIMVAISVVALTAFCIFYPEARGFFVGHWRVMRGEPVIYYQAWGLPELRQPLDAVCKEKYGFSYRGGLGCTNTWEDRYLNSIGKVSGNWLKRKYGKEFSEILSECRDLACKKQFGMDYNAYMESKYGNPKE